MLWGIIQLGRLLRAWWEHHNWAAKDAEIIEVGLLASLECHGCMLPIAMHGGVVDSQVIMEGIWPVLCWQTNTMEHGLHGIPNSPMRKFNRTILIGMTRSSVLNILACLLE